ncbi:MAG: signal peptide peptidase SppA [Kofleriaceae bacterium]
MRLTPRRVAVVLGLLTACQGSADRFAGRGGGDAGARVADPWGGPPASSAASARRPASPNDDGGGLDLASLVPAVLTALSQPGRYEAPEVGSAYVAGAPHTDVLELGGAIVETEAYSLRGGSGTPLRELTERLRGLAADPTLTGVLVRLDELEVSVPDAVELRAAMAALRDAGKTLACHTEGVSNTSYLVLAACGQIGLAPLGTVVVSGPTAMPIHLRPLLAKLGVTADFLHVGAFKGAAEPLTRDAPSPEMLETLDAILDRRYQTMIDAIAASRGLSADDVRAAIDVAILPAEDALRRKLVDVVEPFEAFRQRVAGDAWREVELEPEASPDQALAKLMAFVGLAPTAPPPGPHVALVYAVGDVVDGGGDGALGARTDIASHTLVAALRALAADDDVRAVVLRIDSGGGSALASELIWHEVAALVGKKPVVVSMSDVAASGGYYIAAAATRIFALDDTLTGSIGVVGGKLAPGGALEQLGVRAYPLGRGKRATMFSRLGPWTADERAAMQTMMEATYQTFVGRVAAGRGKSAQAIQPIAQGRVWVGAEAMRLGLVDEIGGLDAALADAARRGGVDPAAAIEVYPATPTLRDVVAQIGDVAVGSLAGVGAAAAEEALAALAPTVAARARQLWAQVVRFEQSPLQTVALLPAIE